MALNSNEHWTLIFSPLLLITLTSFFKKKLYYYSTNPQIFNVLHYNEDLDNNMREFYCKSQSYINDEKHMKLKKQGNLSLTHAPRVCWSLQSKNWGFGPC